MEWIVCMLLASLITAARPVSDALHLLNGKEPPHLTKARLKADQKARKLAEQRAARENRQPRPGEDKPTLRDVARVYWGDAMADVIDAHDRRRAEKKAQRDENNRARAEGRPPVRVRPSWRDRAARAVDLLVNGRRPAAREGVDVADVVQDTLTPDEMLIVCPDCGQRLVGRDGRWGHPSSAGCPNRPPAGAAQPAAPPAGSGVPAAATPAPAAAKPGPPRVPSAPAPPVRGGRTQVPAEQPQDLPQAGWQWSCRHCPARASRRFPTLAASNADFAARHPVCPIAGPLTAENGGNWFFQCGVCGYRSAQIYPDDAASDAALAAHICRNEQADRPDVYAWPCPDCHTEQESTDRAQSGTACPGCRAAKKAARASNSTEGDDMTDAPTAGSATGDAHDLETAAQQCDLLDDDLGRINTAIDVIDEAIGSAGTATELIEAFLRSKNVDDTTVGGMATAREMLGPDRIKALIDAISAAKQGVLSTKEELEAMHDGATAALKGADGSIVNGR